MIIHIWKGVLKVPIKLFYILALIFIFLCAICVERIQQWKLSPQAPCSERTPDYVWTGGRKRPAGQHFACSEDPVVYNTWKSCPECFRPTVEYYSLNFTEIPHSKHTFPRGTPGYFKPRPTMQQDIIHNVLITPSSVCVGSCPYLIAIQLSIAEETDERDAVRSTWGSAAKTKIWPHASINADFQILFVLASKSEASDRMAKVRAEAKLHGDILLLDMIDSYSNLTLKLISSLNWARYHCPRTKFFLKVDSDTFVNIPLLLDLLIYNEELLEFSVIGHIYSDDRYVYRSGRWGVSKKIYPAHMFPVYASGCAYIISQKVLYKMVELYPYMPMINLEDVFITGILGRAAKIKFFPHDLYEVFTDFHSDKWDWCQFLNDTLITGTGVNRVFKKNIIWSGFVFNDWVCRRRNLLNMPCYCKDEY